MRPTRVLLRRSQYHFLRPLNRADRRGRLLRRRPDRAIDSRGHTQCCAQRVPMAHRRLPIDVQDSVPLWLRSPSMLAIPPTDRSCSVRSVLGRHPPGSKTRAVCHSFQLRGLVMVQRHPHRSHVNQECVFSDCGRYLHVTVHHFPLF